MTDAKEGHIVKDGRVVQCPFITVNIEMIHPTTNDKLV